METNIRNLLKISKSSLYALIFITSTSYAGGNSISSEGFTSNLYGSYTLSTGKIDWNKSSSHGGRQPQKFPYISINGWLGKKLSSDTEAVLGGKYVYFDRAGNIRTPEDDAIRNTLHLDLLHIRHYDNSSSFLNLGYVYAEELESGTQDGSHNTYLASIGYATNSVVIDFGLGTSNVNLGNLTVDELIYYHLTYKKPITSKINLLISKHYSEYESKIGSSRDRDGQSFDITGLKITYDLPNSYLSLGGDRYDVHSVDGDSKGGSYYFSWNIPFGSSSHERTKLIMDNRPAIDQVVGFGATH